MVHRWLARDFKCSKWIPVESDNQLSAWIRVESIWFRLQLNLMGYSELSWDLIGLQWIRVESAGFTVESSVFTSNVIVSADVESNWLNLLWDLIDWISMEFV